MNLKKKHVICPERVFIVCSAKLVWENQLHIGKKSVPLMVRCKVCSGVTRKVFWGDRYHLSKTSRCENHKLFEGNLVKAESWIRCPSGETLPRRLSSQAILNTDEGGCGHRPTGWSLSKVGISDMVLPFAAQSLQDASKQEKLACEPRNFVPE